MSCHIRENLQEDDEKCTAHSAELHPGEGILDNHSEERLITQAKKERVLQQLMILSSELSQRGEQGDPQHHPQ